MYVGVLFQLPFPPQWFPSGLMIDLVPYLRNMFCSRGSSRPILCMHGRNNKAIDWCRQNGWDRSFGRRNRCPYVDNKAPKSSIDWLETLESPGTRQPKAKSSSITLDPFWKVRGFSYDVFSCQPLISQNYFRPFFSTFGDGACPLEPLNFYWCECKK